MKTLRNLLTCSLFLVCCAASILAQSVQTDYDHNFNLNKFRTFGFAQSTRRAGDALAANPINDRRIHDALNTQLLANGFAAGSQPDFWISYYVTARKGFNVQDNRVGILQRMGSVNVNEVTEGTLIVAFFDADTRQEVWRGYVTGEIDPKDLDKDVNKSIAKLIQKFKKNQAGQK